MALARSASVPGGLSINTGAANLFGSNTTSQPAAGGLFGTAGAQTTATTPAAKPGGLFGGGGLTVPAATPAATGGLFGGAATTATTTAAATSSLFGAATTTTTATTTPAATGGLFGAAAKPAAGGGLFGGAAPAATTAPAAGGLFGGATPAAAAAPAAGGGLFGGAAPAAAAPAGGSGLFGGAAPAATAAPASQPSAFGGSLFGQPAATTTAAAAATAQPQAGTTVPGVRIDLSNLKGTTRFNDLHESLQKDIIAIDSLIQGYVEQKNQVAAFLPAHGDSLAAIPGDVRFVARKYDGVAAALATDLEAIHVLRETVKQDANHAQRSFQALDNQKLPAQFHTSGLWSGGDKRGGSNGNGGSGPEGGKAGEAGDAGGGGSGQAGGSDLISYFSRTGDDIGEQLRRLEKNLGEIEVHMYGVQSGLLEQLQRVASSSASASAGGGFGPEGGSVSAEEKVAELAAVLREFEDSILTVASVVGTAREDMTALQLGRYLGGR